jgi:zinc protease
MGDNQSLSGRDAVAAMVRASLMSGTSKHDRQHIQDELGRLKSQINVSGTLGVTQVTVQTTAVNLEAVLRLAAEILKEPSFPADEFEQARQAQLTALESSRTDPAFLAPNMLARRLNLYRPDHPLYTPTVEESTAQVKAVTLEAARALHSDLYGASSAELAIVGDFDPATVTTLAAELFGDWKSRRPYAEPKGIYSRTEADQLTIALRDKASAMVTAGQSFAVSQTNADYPALVLANYMMGGHSTSRLYLRIRGKEGLSYRVSSTLNADANENSGEWIMSATTNPVNAPKLVQVFLEEVGLVLKNGFAAEEVAAAKQGWTETRVVQRSQDTTLAERLVLNEHYGRTMAFDSDLEAKVAALAPDQINSALRRHLDPARIVIIKAGDFAQ